MLSENFLINAFTVILIILSSIYLYFKYKFTYWTKENVVHLEPKIPFGNAKGAFTMTQSFGDMVKNIYDEMKSKTKSFGGIYMFTAPVLVIVDPELAKNVLTKDFGHFFDRDMFVDEENDPLGAHLVALKGQRWKNARAKITPTFTSGKMKIMFNTILSTTEHLSVIIDQKIEKNESLDTRDIFARFATDTIGSCAFGLDCNSLEDPETKFLKYGRKVFGFEFRDAIIGLLAMSYPSVLKFFKIPQTAPDVTEFFMNVLKQTVDYREKNNIQRNDFLNLLIRMKNKQSVLDDQTDSKEEEGITFNELAAHAFVFFIGGFETSSSTLDFCLFELAQNLEVQEKARNEVIQILKDFKGELNYEAVMSLKYMDKVFSEVLRKYPPLPMLGRECTKDYPIPNSDYVIKKGISVLISTLGLQRDPEYYPEPDKFDPERFTEEEKSKRHTYTYLPFGEGPRNCIGMRFALLQVKIVLAVLLKNYKFTLDPRTVTSVVFNPKSIFLSPKDTFWIKAEKI